MGIERCSSTARAGDDSYTFEPAIDACEYLFARYHFLLHGIGKGNTDSRADPLFKSGTIAAVLRTTPARAGQPL